MLLEVSLDFLIWSILLSINKNIVFKRNFLYEIESKKIIFEYITYRITMKLELMSEHCGTKGSKLNTSQNKFGKMPKNVDFSKFIFNIFISS